MEPYLSELDISNGKLYLRWHVYANPHAFFIAVSTKCDLSDTSRIFVIPGHVRSCSLDLGAGSWYARVGAMTGLETNGVITWSGVYGPHRIQTEQVCLPNIAATITVRHTSPINNGIRFHVATNSPAYYIFETWTEGGPISANWTYYRDIGRGYADCGGIAYPTKYGIRVRDLACIPKDTLVQLTEGIMYESQTSAKPTPILDSTDHAVAAADKAFIRQTTFQQNVRFASHADYVRYQAALAKMSG